VSEFQGQTVSTAWYNLLTKIGLYGKEHPERDVIGIGVFCTSAMHRPSCVERFRGLTAKEIWAMLNLITPI
jgi:hypothetical protein